MPLPKGVLTKIMDVANKLAYEGKTLGAGEKRLLLDYLKGDGRNAAMSDMHPGIDPANPYRVADPKPGETWYRGGPASLKLQNPIFTTRDKEGAAWFATERGNKNIGAVGEYTAEPKKAARLRDLYRVGLDNDLQTEMAEYQNALDWTYNADFRKALMGEGYDSALASDTLGSSDIDALVGLTPDIFTPKARSIVTYEDHPIFQQTGKHPKQYGGSGEYFQLGDTKPWSRKARGGLVQYHG